jgi:hypothetical protein
VIVFMQPAPLPVGHASEAGTSLIPTSDSQHASADAPEVLAPGQSISDPFDFSIASPEPTFDTPSNSSFDTTPVTYAPAPTALTISQSGYTSSLAGTPADQEPPKDGLPTETIAGRVTKYSFIRLVGSGASIKLKALTDDGAGLNEADARVQLCHITTAGWKPARPAAPADAPQYDTACLEGKNANGVWTFNFSSIQNPVDPNGWAIVPVTADSATFRVTFAPSAA